MEFKPLIGITYEFIFQLVNTFLVFFLLKKLLFKPVLGIIEAREKDIREDLAQGERAKKEGLSLKSEYEEKLNSAKEQGQEIIKQATLRAEQKENEIIEKYTYPIRKLAHYTLYFILGILSFLVVKDYSINKKLIIYSLLICFLYACSDEFHQLFIIGRSARVLDVMIDTFGSLCGISIFYIFNKKISKKSI